MKGRRKTSQGKAPNGATLGFEEKLWQAADKLRGHMDAAEYKRVVLGLIFLNYISDPFQDRYQLGHGTLPSGRPRPRSPISARNYGTGLWPGGSRGSAGARE